MDDTLYQQLLNHGFRFVSYRPRSEKETRDFLERKLKRKKVYFDPKILEKVIARLKELTYLDDTKFARWWVEQRLTHMPKGKRLIILELVKKGLARETAEEAFSLVSNQFRHDRSENDYLHPEKESALRAIQKKLKIWGKLPVLEQKKKIYGFLGRRGFSVETIEAVIDEIGSLGVK